MEIHSHQSSSASGSQNSMPKNRVGNLFEMQTPRSLPRPRPPKIQTE